MDPQELFSRAVEASLAHWEILTIAVNEEFGGYVRLHRAVYRLTSNFAVPNWGFALGLPAALRLTPSGQRPVLQP